MNRAALHDAPCTPATRAAPSARAFGLLITVLVHLGVLVALLWPDSTARQDPAALPPMQVSLLAAPYRAPAPAVLDMTPPLPAPEIFTPEIVVQEPTEITSAPMPSPLPPRPSQAAPSGAIGAAPTLQRRGAVSPDCLPRGWLLQMSQTIGLSQRYPAASRQRGERGTVTVRVSVARNGRVLDAPLLRSSGYPSLDFEARDVMRRIGRFAPLPDADCAGYDVIVVDQPVRFGGG